MTTEKLKPCPWCGGKAQLVATGDSRLHYIGCHQFKCSVVPKTLYYDTLDDAISAWNERKGETT